MGYDATSNIGLRKTNDTGSAYQDSEDMLGNNNSNMDIIEKVISGVASAIGTNASIVNTGGFRFVPLYACSAGSISTITGMLTNVPFTLMMMSSGASLALVDGGNKLLSANWIPNTTKGNITLVWDGTNYIELGRSAT